ncbi:MAG: DNA phosphorothioation-associated putative methyltransferase [Bacteriovoracaceae bacterium]|jgi:DNA phosphorothioation-associated putative methyltransferase|nr:DNA phosphorothioation-associated putative methyltransferase [Bacteriovoracaceae bacterium]
MIKRHKTAIKRYKLSRPVFLLTEHNLLHNEVTFFDYGCGHGQDTQILKKNGFRNINQFDPFYFPDKELIPSELVNLGYVLNVIENPKERRETLIKAFSLAKVAICVSVMVRSATRNSTFNQYNDGEISTRGTFQKYFEQTEFKNYLESTLNADAIPLEPGIFVVFKSEIAKLEYLSSRYTRRSFLEVTKLDKPTGEVHKVRILKKKLEELIPESPFFPQVVKAVEEFGRMLMPNEFEPFDQLLSEYKSKKKIEGIILENINEDTYLNNRAIRIEEILVFMALRRFDRNGFPKKKDLPEKLKLDIEKFLGSYREVITQAEKLLFSIGNESIMRESFRAAPIGKNLPQALYIHSEYVQSLPAPLQVKVGVAKSLVGSVEDCTIIKINKLKDKISFLIYEDFIKVPHPVLLYSYSVDLRKNYVDFWDFRNRENPPILHRKETFIDKAHPKYKLFCKLSKAEKEKGLLSLPNIGTKINWENLLQSKNLKLKGHSLNSI